MNMTLPVTALGRMLCRFHVNAGVAYSTSKFAVRGLTEGLIKDFAKHAPHVTVHLAMGSKIIFMPRLFILSGITDEIYRGA
jgi:NAD(P)-dependent dehydrogenase (short-subunit alcohol dehydrogenase family)